MITSLFPLQAPLFLIVSDLWIQGSNSWKPTLINIVSSLYIPFVSPCTDSGDCPTQGARRLTPRSDHWASPKSLDVQKKNLSHGDSFHIFTCISNTWASRYSSHIGHHCKLCGKNENDKHLFFDSDFARAIIWFSLLVYNFRCPFSILTLVRMSYYRRFTPICGIFTKIKKF
jgi:hypothetical protein